MNKSEYLEYLKSRLSFQINKKESLKEQLAKCDNAITELADEIDEIKGGS